MVIHSIVSQYDIFCSGEQADIIERNVQGGRLSLINVNGEYKPHRLFSTNPSMYLDPKYQSTQFYF